MEIHERIRHRIFFVRLVHKQPYVQKRSSCYDVNVEELLEYKLLSFQTKKEFIHKLVYY